MAQNTIRAEGVFWTAPAPPRPYPSVHGHTVTQSAVVRLPCGVWWLSAQAVSGPAFVRSETSKGRVTASHVGTDPPFPAQPVCREPRLPHTGSLSRARSVAAGRQGAAAGLCAHWVGRPSDASCIYSPRSLGSWREACQREKGIPQGLARPSSEDPISQGHSPQPLWGIMGPATPRPTPALSPAPTLTSTLAHGSPTCSHTWIPTT